MSCALLRDLSSTPGHRELVLNTRPLTVKPAKRMGLYLDEVYRLQIEQVF